MSTLGLRLKKAREHAGLSQKQLEERAGVSQKTISKIERGDQDSSTQVVQLARHLGVNASWLATGEGDMITKPLGAQQPPAEYQTLSEESLEIARMWDQLAPDRRDWFRQLMALEAIVAKHYPWLMFGRPKRESYNEYERRIERDLLRLAARLQGEKSK
jgi:transcriptional regulator with XRE-family HTH domain